MCNTDLFLGGRSDSSSLWNDSSGILQWRCHFHYSSDHHGEVGNWAQGYLCPLASSWPGPQSPGWGDICLVKGLIVNMSDWAGWKQMFSDPLILFCREGWGYWGDPCCFGGCVRTIPQFCQHTGRRMCLCRSVSLIPCLVVPPPHCFSFVIHSDLL